MKTQDTGQAAARRPGAAMTWVLLLLFVSGWGANHFVALIPVLEETQGLTKQVLDGAFGVYVFGLLPGLLGGGGISDRVGRRPVLLLGAFVAALGNAIVLAWHDVPGIYAGRLVVGVGVGLAMSAGTAWAADLGGKRGTTLAGAILTSGFAAGAFVAGLVAQQWRTLTWPLLLSIAASLVTVALAARSGGSSSAGGEAPPVVDAPGPQSLRLALVASIPMALWVFATVTIPQLVLAPRLVGLRGPWVPGMAAAVGLGTGVLVQVVARRQGWGPVSGVVGAALAACGYALAAAAGSAPGLPLFLLASVVFGSAYGLCLREGLTDVETLAPTHSRGIAIGVFYLCTYLGFGLPVLLETIRPWAGMVWPYVVLALLAAAAAAMRALHIRGTDHFPRG